MKRNKCKEPEQNFRNRVMSASETVPILANSSVTVNEVQSALSVACSDSSAEDVPLVPEVIFESALDSPGLNRESQPLLGGLDVSYNQFPGNIIKHAPTQIKNRRLIIL